MIEYCRQEQISVITHSSLAKGILCGKYETNHTFAPEDERSTFPGYSGSVFADYLAVVNELKNVAAEEGLTIDFGGCDLAGPMGYEKPGNTV